MFGWASAVYILCLLASAACAWLLIRSYARRRTLLLLWSAVSFLFLALNNLLVVIDLLLVPSIDMTIARELSSLIAVLVLLWGFIWEVD